MSHKPVAFAWSLATGLCADQAFVFADAGFLLLRRWFARTSRGDDERLLLFGSGN
jgi:hypothetical protein